MEQQSAFASEFGADVRAQMVAEEGHRREAAAAKATLRHMRQRLAELTALNADRQARADEVAAQQQALQVGDMEGRLCIRFPVKCIASHCDVHQHAQDHDDGAWLVKL